MKPKIYDTHEDSYIKKGTRFACRKLRLLDDNKTQIKDIVFKECPSLKHLHSLNPEGLITFTDLVKNPAETDIYKRYKTIIIHTKTFKKTRWYQLLSVFHEMVHAKQYLTGKLNYPIESYDYYYWKSKKRKTTKNFFSYYYSPKEIEARWMSYYLLFSFYLDIFINYVKISGNSVQQQKKKLEQ